MIVLMALVAILLVWFIVVSVMMLRGAARPAPKNATVIVLGAAVYGETPCLMLTQRLDACLLYTSTWIAASGSPRCSSKPTWKGQCAC